MFDTQAAEYVSFKRQNITRWGVIQQLLNQIERLLTQYVCNIAYVDVQRLLDLSERDQERYSNDEILSCITNRVQIDDAMNNPRMCFKGANGPVLAAIRIQTTWRRHKAYSAF